MQIMTTVIPSRFSDAAYSKGGEKGIDVILCLSRMICT